MSKLIYYCTSENNHCPKKESCERYCVGENIPHSTLFKMSCTENNNYSLFIKKETVEENIESKLETN